MKCNGCPKDGAAEPRQDPGILEKVERLSQEGIEAVHVGVCRFQKTENGERKECERLMEICQIDRREGDSGDPRYAQGIKLKLSLDKAHSID